MTGLTRAAAAKTVASYFGTTAEHICGGYDTYTVRDSAKRTWKIVKNASISCQNGSCSTSSNNYSVEFVSPICVYNDIETIQQLVRNFRAEGAAVNSSCGIHIHINGVHKKFKEVLK